MSTAGTATGEIEKAPATAAATAKDATATAQAADKAADKAAADAKPNGTDPADKADAAGGDGKTVAKPVNALDDNFEDDETDDETVSTAEGATETAKTPAGDWPDDWREKMANGNDKLLAALKRYKSPIDWTNAGFAAQQKIRSGDYKAKLADDATPEEKAAWRKENNIPEEAKAYEIQLANHKWTDADTPMLDGFKGVAHEANLSQPQVTKVLGYYAELVEQAKVAQTEKLQEIDTSDVAATGDALRAELGGEYRPSMTLVKRLLNDTEVFSADVAAAFQTARTPDGHRFINNPEVLRFFMSQARERYGDGAFITGDAKAAMASEEEKWVNLMKTDFSEYVRQGGSEKLAAIRAKKSGGRAA